MSLPLHSPAQTPPKQGRGSFASALDWNDAVLEKHNLRPATAHRWFHRLFVPYAIKVPSQRRRVLVPVPALLLTDAPYRIPFFPRRHSRLHHKRFSWPALILILWLALLLFGKIKNSQRFQRIHVSFLQPSTRVVTPEQISAIWRWEMDRGHYPSSWTVPAGYGLEGATNPAVDATRWNAVNKIVGRGPPKFPEKIEGVDAVRPTGPRRDYLDIPQPPSYSVHHATNTSFPRRPAANTVIDLDVVMQYCNFATNQYVRDCLEVLRSGAGLDLDRRIRRGDTEPWKHLYHQPSNSFDSSKITSPFTYNPQDIMHGLGYIESQATDAPRSGKSASFAASNAIDIKKRRDRVGSHPHPTHPTADPTCDPDYPRLFHIFWAGPFTDKPYAAVLSFLYTQNLGLHISPTDEQSRSAFLDSTCRPQLWVWINPGPAAAIPNPNARAEMFANLAENPWSAPFLHQRFEQVVKFKMWNTTEQLDGVPEMRDKWRDLPLFNSGGVKWGKVPLAREIEKMEERVEEHGVEQVEAELQGRKDPTDRTADQNKKQAGEVDPEAAEELGRFGAAERGEEAVAADRVLGTRTLDNDDEPTANATHKPAAPKKKALDEEYLRVGTTSSDGYDRLTVVLSDMARFVLTHRFGGIYLDADTLFLRDWEELWGWKGAFAYRWSRLEKYNTAVLKLHRNSALGSFLFKTALANGLDFHPMTISRYTKDAQLEGLLLRLPDALFDPAWLNTEDYQRDRPAFPFFTRFDDFFDSPKEWSAAPLALGFKGFFQGAFSYHFHNFWWRPFDPSRNWPDLGKRFESGEKKARAKILTAKRAAEAPIISTDAKKGKGAFETGVVGKVPLRDGTRLEVPEVDPDEVRIDQDRVEEDERDLNWATVLKRTFESYIRGESPNMYGEWINFD